MKVNCPKCGSSLEDKHGGILTKCPKCGLDGDIVLDMVHLKNEYEIENREGEFITKWDKSSP